MMQMGISPRKDDNRRGKREDNFLLFKTGHKAHKKEYGSKDALIGSCLGEGAGEVPGMAEAPTAQVQHRLLSRNSQSWQQSCAYLQQYKREDWSC